VPEGPSFRLPEAFSAVERQRLIDTGIYNADGTVNMNTAEKQGWAATWRKVQEQKTKPIETSPDDSNPH